MGNIRIPVSLKFDTSTEFYSEFINDLRDRRVLSDFIVNILKVYFENESIKELINLNLDVYDPMTKIKEQINRAQLEHAKAVMSTSMMENHFSKTREHFNETGELKQRDYVFEDEGNQIHQSHHQQTTNQQEVFLLTGATVQNPNLDPQGVGNQGSGAQQPTNDFISRLEVIEKTLPSIAEQMHKLTALLTNQNTVQQQAVTTQQSTPQPVSTQPPIEQVIQPVAVNPIDTSNQGTDKINPSQSQSKPVVENNLNPSVNQPTQTVNSTTNTIQPEIQQPVAQQQAQQVQQQEQPVPAPQVEPSVQPIIILGSENQDNPAPSQTSAPTITIGGSDDEVEEQPKKKSSFGKAFKSLKN